jgi:hypothetical protein
MAKATMKAVKFHRQTRLSQVIEVGGAFEVQLASWWLFVLKWFALVLRFVGDKRRLLIKVFAWLSPGILKACFFLVWLLHLILSLLPCSCWLEKDVALSLFLLGVLSFFFGCLIFSFGFLFCYFSLCFGEKFWSISPSFILYFLFSFKK